MISCPNRVHLFPAKCDCSVCHGLIVCRNVKEICKPYISDDAVKVTAIWNDIVLDSNAFPQEKLFTKNEADIFFQSQTATTSAFADDELAGFYILHDNNVGRCSHTANASYGVGKKFRGCGIGKILVTDSHAKAKAEVIGDFNTTQW